MNKRGWIHILEATIAVMIVAGVMVAVYSDQLVRDDLTVAEYSYNLQTEILDSITLRSDLRLGILNVVTEDESDDNFRMLNDIIGAEVPESFGYFLRVCDLSDPDDVCNMPEIIFTATLGKNVFVEETIVSSELGNGTEAVASPKKIRLFLWEGEADFGDDDGDDDGGSVCGLECNTLYYPTSRCSNNYNGVVNTSCVEVDGCLEKVFERETCGEGYACESDGSGDVGSASCIERCDDSCSEDRRYCSGGDVWKMDCVAKGKCLVSDTPALVKVCGALGCENGACVEASVDMWELTCEKEIFKERSCENECLGYDIRRKTNTCNFGLDDFYSCYDIESIATGCKENPICPGGYEQVANESCSL